MYVVLCERFNKNDSSSSVTIEELDGVTTVLLVSAKQGKSAPPIGLLTKTARTFVQDGASTEFATQVVGTTLDNGRLYARILSTSSRVFYDKEPSPDPTSPYVVYPSRAPKDDWQLGVALDNAPIKAIKDLNVLQKDEDIETSTEDQNEASSKTTSNLDELSRENDIFNKRELNANVQRFKPAKVRPAENLPTYTVKQEYVTSSFDALDEEPKSYRPRAPKIFKLQPKASALKKIDVKNFATVTYHGFADFTTTVGDTVIVFSPSTSPVPAGRPATTIKGDATLRPDDGVAVLKIKPTNVVVGHQKTENPRQSKDQFLDAINGGIQSSVPEEVEVESSSRSTDPLLWVPETGSVKATGLLKVIDSTTSSDGTTTHYKSSIYGTFIGTNYAQIIHTSSNVYFFPEESTLTYGTEDTTSDYSTTGTESDDFDLDETDGTTTGTTPRIFVTTEESPMNELTTPYEKTTDSVLTTLKDILESARKVLGTTESAIPMLDDETANDILPVDPQGRSIKGLANRNNLENKNDKGQDQSDNAQKTSLATRLLPSTVYKTFTYFTTFFIPGDNDQTTTSIKSREVISSEVSYLTELILPSATQSTLHATVSPKPAFRPKVQIQAEPEEEQTTKQDEEIELIFKTLYTTYTYLTTFFQESTSSVSSREVVETNIITQTVGANGVSEYDRLFDKEESAVIAPTKIAQIFPSVTTRLPSDTMEGTPTVPNDEEISFRGTTEPTTTENGLEGTTDSSNTEIEPSPTPSLSVEEYQEQVKTYYTTYTYFTTIFVDDETEIETRTEVFSNIVTETIKPTSVLPVPQNTVTSNSKSEESKGAVPPEILAYLEALKRQKSQEEALSLAKKAKPVKPEVQTEKDDYETTTDYFIETTTDNPTTVEDRYTENSYRDFNVQVTPNPPVEGEVLGSMITDVVSTSSSGGGTVLEVMDKRNAVPEDQELSESNHHDVEPAPTLLLQTSYTTFTYFTTMYKGEESNVVSRLETVTNVATETIRPTAVVLAETSTLPVTYFTTFTYWTTFYRGGDTVTTSREETISNVVTPGVSATPTVQLGVIMTYRPSQSSSPFDDELVEEKESKATADNEVTPADRAVSEKAVTQETPTLNGINTRPSEDSAAETSLILPEPTTYYTTFTYFTTSYIGNETILNSRLETVTSVSRPEAGTPQATGRAIGTSVPPLVQALDTESKSVRSSKTEDVPKTGLISTIRSSNVQDGTTTHYATDVYGTYIDGLYAQVVESSTRLETSTPSPSSVATPILPTGVLSLNKGSVIDADEVTTVYFTTKQIGTLIDGLYAKVIESTSSTKIDEERKATLPPPHGHRTGLVRLIQGNIENNGTTTFYQSKVIGTSIDGRYAQIIESTSTFVAQTATKGVSPSSTIPPNQATGVPAISPSPAAIQSSLSEDHSTDSTDDESEENEGEESEEEDEEGGLGKKKSRLTFSSRKRTFTPVIRPFISRNRPTFNPKRKGAQGATTITRTDITPTITATLAGKSNRFASSRGRVTSPVGPYSSTLAPSGSRRFSGRRSSVTSSSVLNTASAGSTRGRQAARIAPSSVFQGNRRTPTSIRGSSSRGSIRGSSSAFPVASSRYRPGIRPSSTLLRGQSTAKHEDQEDDANEFTTTTLTTEETPFTEFTDAGETTPYQTTTESSRRSTNPLLRFRRPLNTRPSTTPRPSTTTAPRRTGNLNRQTPPTVPNRAANARSNNRVPTPIASRTRTGNTGLFPPRSLFGRKQVETPVEETTLRPDVEGEEKHESHIEDHPVEEISDNDYEGSEHEDRATTTANVTRRSGKSLVSPVQIRPFGRPRRTRRQASQLRQLTNRFRSTTPKFEERSDIIDSSTSREEFPKTYAKPTSRYSVRGRSLTTSRSSSSESAEVSQQNQSRPRTNSSRVKPSPITASNRQFTLREKDGSTTNRSGYKRPSTTSRSRTPSKSTDRNRSLRLTGRNGSDSRRGSSRGSSRSSGRSNNNRRLNHRGRGSYENIRESPLIYPDTDGTITVTHYVPTDVTIPVVSNGVTEQRNIITARPSTEILGPEQYSTVVGGDGRPLVVIVSEATGTNNQGQTEITRFLLHETPTTRISHTLTTLGGRRASQSVIVPSTVYSVENIVSTIHPSIPGNSPLANILLSQLLLGQLGQQNPLGTSQASPTTQYSTRTTSYVTTITKQQSTVIPLTFRGKEILTTLVDTSTNVVTATEFITDTVVVTPTAAIPQANLNSLLLLLQQPQSQQQPNPLADPLFAASPLTQSNTLPGEVERRNQPADFDYRPDSYEYSEEEDDSYDGTSKSRSNRKDKKEKKATEKTAASAESSVVTLYVSGRRPGEFSTVLSTVKIGDESTVSRRRRDILGNAEVRPSVPPSLHAGPDPVDLIAGSEQPIHAHAPTQSLESVVGDVGRHISTSTYA
ncbi:mucin-22 [Prorops nasuta]|uniref:mucin-22 n=1 Tax=Prorops nasuta TaxID=863751 RepID=UPI0034CFF964